MENESVKVENENSSARKMISAVVWSPGAILCQLSLISTAGLAILKLSGVISLTWLMVIAPVIFAFLVVPIALFLAMLIFVSTIICLIVIGLIILIPLLIIFDKFYK